MFRDFYAWWTGQLSDLFAVPWGRLGPMREDALVIEPARPLSREVHSIGVNLRRHGRETPLGRFSLAAAELPRPPGKSWVLRLRQADVLAKTVTLPMAAENRVHQALAFQMDQETAFTPDEIYWSYFIVGRDRQGRRLSVRMLLVPRQSLAALLKALDRVGIVPNRVEIGDGPDQDRTLPLDGNGGARDGAARRALLWSAAAACCLLLALGSIATPFVRQAISLARTVTRILPDDTYLTEVTAQQRKVTLSGRSAAAPRLIGALSAGEELRNVAFAAPVTRLEAIRMELFTITAEVAP